MTDLSAEIFEGFEKQSSKGGWINRAIRGGVSVAGKPVKDPSHLKKIRRGYERAATEGMPESFVAELPIMAGEKITKKVTGRKPRIREGIYRAVSEPAMAIDTAAGKFLQKIPGARGLFTSRDRIPWSHKREQLEKTVERASASAPLVKAKNFAVPLIVAGGLERGTRAVLEKRKNNSSVDRTANNGAMMKKEEIRKIAQADGMDRQLREKVASTMLRLHEANKEHEKQAQATRLIYKKAELGLEALPQTYEEMQQKIASMVGQDMAVLEKALELTAEGSGIGELASSEPISSRNAETTFQSEILA